MDESHVASQTWRVTPDPLCILDRQGCFAAVNPAWKATLGWTEAEMIGVPYLTFLHPDDVDRSMTAFEKVKSGKPVFRFENRYRARDGSFRWFSWVAVPEGDFFYCTVRDKTEEKERERIIAEQREEASLREQFLAVLGHDLRNPLGSLIAGVRLLSREEQSERARETLRLMQTSTARMSELIANMMDFARVRLGDGIGLDRRSHNDLGKRISEVVHEIQVAFEDARIEVETDIDGEIYCDAPRMMQVLSNLLGNAVMHGAHDEPITVDADNRDGQLTITVCNKGAPIPDVSRENLFRPFFKGGKHASPQGLGLGLFITSEIVSAHDGHIEVTSDEELTCFEVSIPAVRMGE